MKRNLLIAALLLITAIGSSVVTQAFSGPHPLGMSLIGPVADPSGNGMESYKVIYTDNSGTIYDSGFYLQVHNSAGIRGYSVAAPGTSSAYFEMCTSNSSMVVTGINGANCS